MSKLESIVRGRLQKPIRVVIYSPEGVGKSTFASQAPNPIFLGTESGTEQLDVARFPTPRSWQDMLDSVRELIELPHEFKTLVIDSLDWAEPLLFAHICKRDGMASIESYGYAKGYIVALDEWRNFLELLEKLRQAKPINIILIAHSWIKPFKNPEGPDFDRYEMKLHNKASALIKEWSDATLFANHETFANLDKNTKRAKGVSTGARLIYTNRTASYDAKNRHSLPESLPLNWADFQAAVEAHKPAEPAALIEEINRKASMLGGEIEAGVPASLERINGDAVKLSHLNVWMNSRLHERGIEQ